MNSSIDGKKAWKYLSPPIWIACTSTARCSAPVESLRIPAGSTCRVYNVAGLLIIVPKFIGPEQPHLLSLSAHDGQVLELHRRATFGKGGVAYNPPRNRLPVYRPAQSQARPGQKLCKSEHRVPLPIAKMNCWTA